jgi:O-antigen/teichoic acid export membrane protein
LSAASQAVVQTLAFFLLYRFLIDRLGLEQFGIWAVVLATASVTRLSEMGLAGSVTKFVAAARAEGDDRAASEFIQTAAITLAVILTAALVVVFPVLSHLLPHVLPATAVPAGRSILPYAVASIWLGTIGGIWQSGLDGCLRSDIRAGLMIGTTLLFLMVAYAAVPRFGLIGLASAQVVQGVALLVVGWWLVRHVAGHAPVVPLHWSRKRLRQLIGYGANVQVLALVMVLFEPTTKLLLGRYGGLSAAGTFELAQQLVTKMRALIVESNRVVVPIMAGMNGGGDHQRSLYRRNLQVLLFLVTPLFAALASAIPAISEIWLGHYRNEFVIMGVCLTVGWYVNTLSSPAYFAYLGRGELRWLTLSHIILGFTNGAVGWVAARFFGTMGVLAAFLLSLVLGSVIPVVTYHHEQRLHSADLVSRDDVRLVIVCVIASVMAVAGYTLTVDGGAPWWTRGAWLALMLGAMLVAASRHPLASRMVAFASRRGSPAA